VYQDLPYCWRKQACGLANRSGFVRGRIPKFVQETTLIVLWACLGLRSFSPDFSLWMRFPSVTITLAEVLPVAIVVAVQVGHCKGGCPYPAHHFIDVLTKVGYVKNPTSIFQVRIHQVCSETLQHG
jgi:hypothetical protein